MICKAVQSAKRHNWKIQNRNKKTNRKKRLSPQINLSSKIWILFGAFSWNFVFLISEKFLGLMKTRPEVVSRDTAFLILNPLAGKKCKILVWIYCIDRVKTITPVADAGCKYCLSIVMVLWSTIRVLYKYPGPRPPPETFCWSLYAILTVLQS